MSVTSVRIWECDVCERRVEIHDSTSQPQGWGAIVVVAPPLADPSEGTRHMLCNTCMENLHEELGKQSEPRAVAS